MLAGIGYDIHRLVEGRKLVLGGIQIEYKLGLLGHSDGDVLLHAITDAILGAAGAGDIGELYPDTDPQYRGISSEVILEEALSVAAERRLKVYNLDSIVLAERPKLGPVKKEIRARLAKLLAIPPDRVGVKAKTMEGLGPIGTGEAVAAQAVVLLEESR
ncbi:MAG: 2-C-methyl-D-erythritol 2,4-cyclodiphosphate synthase [Planctomycetes bacterium]|nr:2-C-methyl-D-erythritol 2,4-cyclodiphosphate synthase [Planctomycetota bacterium]